MTFVVYAVLFAVAGVFLYMARFSGRLRITVTRRIDAPMADVYARVADFQRWGEWNPWLEHEADASTTLSAHTNGKGSRYTWDGLRAGTMTVEHLRLVPNQEIEQRATSLNPFKYRGRMGWQFTESEGGTEVTWRFKGRVGFALRPFSPTVQSAIALDFRHGLNKLAALLESPDSPGAAQGYVIEYLGVRDIPACQYVFSTYSGPLKNIGEAMTKGFHELLAGLERRGIQAIGHPMAVYVKTNIKLRTTTCHLGLPVHGRDVVDMSVRDMPAHRAYVVRLTGTYAALDVAWYEAMQRLRMEGLQPDQRIPPFECYMSPEGTGPRELTTELFIPLR